MALQLQKVFKGITGEYWKLMSSSEDYKKGITIVRLGFYISMQVRQESVENFIELRNFKFDGNDYTRENLYGLIKQTEDFSDAVDC